MSEGGTCQYGIEIDLGRLGLHDRRLTVHPADARAVVRIDDPVLDRLDGSPRQVDDHEALAKIAGIGAQSHDIRLELLETGGRRDVERRERLLIDHAAPVEAVARLESLDPSLDQRIIDRSRTRDLIEIAGGDQPLPQGFHRPAPRTDAQLRAGRHSLPAAFRDEILVLLDGRLRRIDRRRRQDRGRLALDSQMRRNFVALRPFRLGGVLLLGLRGDRPQRNGESNACRRAEQRAAREPRSDPVTHQLKSPNARPSSRSPAAPPEGHKDGATTAKSPGASTPYIGFTRAFLWPLP